MENKKKKKWKKSILRKRKRKRSFFFFAVLFGGVLVGFGFKREELQKWGLKLRACYPIIETVTWRRRRRSRRRAF